MSKVQSRTWDHPPLTLDLGLWTLDQESSVTPLPAADLRSNLGTWAVPDCRLPRLAFAMTAALPVEEFDRSFQGQHLFTTYFDTPGFTLRRARAKKESYLTIRVRCYEPAGIYA